MKTVKNVLISPELARAFGESLKALEKNNTHLEFIEDYRISFMDFFAVTFGDRHTSPEQRRTANTMAVTWASGFLECAFVVDIISEDAYKQALHAWTVALPPLSDREMPKH